MFKIDPKTIGRNLLLAAAWVMGGGAVVAFAATQAPIIGEVQFLTVQDPTDVFSRGVMVVGGQNVIIPRNFVFDLPANRLTLQQIFAQAPAACVANGQSGLAKADTCLQTTRRNGAMATILANRTNAGDVIAGDIMLDKGPDTLTGVVTFMNHTNGYFRLNGSPGSDTTGVMVRINDPDGRHTIQQGPGCLAGSQNCSADPRYTVDADNYTITFTTGYPACIPSTVTGGLRTVGSNAAGAGDLFCPQTNRGVSPVPNSARFAPIQLGDSIIATGNFERVGAVEFLSAHTLKIGVRLDTAPGQPDYLNFDLVEWDAAGFQNERSRVLLIGFTSLRDSQLDVYGLHHGPNNVAHEVIVGSTVGNPDTTNQGIGNAAGGIWKIRYDVDFAAGTAPQLSPCVNLTNSGLSPAQSGCPSGGTLDIAQNFAKLTPIPRDVIARTRNKSVNNIGDSQDIRGNAAPNGEYVNPVGIGHPEFVEIDLSRLQTPFIFEGQPWNLNRRLGPGGCVGPCGNVGLQPLDPFPFSGLNPTTQAQLIPANSDRIFAFWQGGANGGLTGRLPYSLTPPQFPVDPPAQGMVPTPIFPQTPPRAMADLGVTRKGKSITIDLIDNDESAGVRTTAANQLKVVKGPKNGSVRLGEKGEAIYTPMPGFVGTDHFHYSIVRDGVSSYATLVKVEVRQ